MSLDVTGFALLCTRPPRPLAAVHFVMSFAWFALLSALVERSRRLLSRPAVSRAIDVVTRAALVGFGLRLALARR